MKKKITFLPVLVASAAFYSCSTDRIDGNINKIINHNSQISILLGESKDKYDFSYSSTGIIQSISNEKNNKKGIFIYDSENRLIAIKSTTKISEFNYSGNQITSISSKTLDGKRNGTHNITYSDGGNTIQIDTKWEGTSLTSKDIFKFKDGNLTNADLGGKQLNFYYDDKINPFGTVNKEIALLEGLTIGNFGGLYLASKNNVIRIEQKYREDKTFSIFKTLENTYDNNGRIIKITDKDLLKKETYTNISYN